MQSEQTASSSQGPQTGQKVQNVANTFQRVVPTAGPQETHLSSPLELQHVESERADTQTAGSD